METSLECSAVDIERTGLSRVSFKILSYKLQGMGAKIETKSYVSSRRRI